MKLVAVAIFLTVASSASAAEVRDMTDKDLLAARLICTEAQTAGGGTLAGQPELAKMCTPIILEHDKRLKETRAKQSNDASQKLRELLKK